MRYFFRRLFSVLGDAFHMIRFRMMNTESSVLVYPTVTLFDKPNMYIGTCQHAIFLMKKGIQLSTLEPLTREGFTTGTACIGYNPFEYIWYGWSHRAIRGFAVGSTIKEGECGFEAIGNFTAKSLEDAKRMAIAFAESVS